MYAYRYRLRSIYGVILLLIALYMLWGLTYGGTHAVPTLDREWCPVGSAELAPCPS